MAGLESHEDSLIHMSSAWVEITRIVGSAGDVDWPFHVASVFSSMSAGWKGAPERHHPKTELFRGPRWKLKELFLTNLKVMPCYFCIP